MNKRKLSKDEIALRIARDIADGTCVNLGIGVPTLVAKYIPAGREVIVHAENGILGVGAPAQGDAIDLDVPITHQEIASRVGCSREMVSRILKDLQSGGYVRIVDHRIVLVGKLPQRW